MIYGLLNPSGFISFETPVDLGNGVSLVAAPQWCREEQLVKRLSAFRQVMMARSARLALVTDDASPAAQAFPLTGDEPDGLERLRQANLSMWLARPTAANVEVVAQYDRRIGREPEELIAPLGEWEHIKTHLYDFSEVLEPDNLAAATAINTAILSVKSRSSTATALRMLWRALTDSWWQNRYLLLWIALEALFGSIRAQGEITYRLSQRLSLFLGQTAEEAKSLFDRTKHLYALRSQIVHGLLRASSLRQGLPDDVHATEYLVRSALRLILLKDLVRGKFDHDVKREAFLDDLIFSAGR